VLLHTNSATKVCADILKPEGNRTQIVSLYQMYNCNKLYRHFNRNSYPYENLNHGNNKIDTDSYAYTGNPILVYAALSHPDNLLIF